MAQHSALTWTAAEGLGGRWTSTFGRARDLAAVQELLDRSDGRLVTIAGRAGVGKTHLAQRVADAAGSCKVVRVPLGSLLGPELVVPEIASRLGLSLMPGVSPLDAVAGHIASGQTLLLLDNFEHVLGAAPSILELLDQSPGLQVLVTSQAALKVGGEHVHTLLPLPLPEGGSTGDLEALLTQPAVGLYCDRARSVDHRFTLSKANAEAVVSLCHLLEGLPLAIELAAARSLTLPAETIVARGDDSPLDLLHRKRTSTPSRLDDLRTAIEWSYQLLEPTEQELLRRCSISSAPISIELAEALCGDTTSEVIDRLSGLVDLHLIDPVRDTSPIRFAMPSSIRAFAHEELAEHGEVDAAQAAYVRALAAIARDLTAGHATANEVEWLATVDETHENLLDAAFLAVRRGMADEALDLGRTLVRRWEYRGYKPTNGELLTQILELSDGTTSAAYVELLAWSAYLALRERTWRDPQPLITRLQEAEALAERIGDTESRLHALAATALCSPLIQDFGNGFRAVTEGLAVARDIANARWIGRFEAWLGAMAHQMKDDERAISLARSALARGRATDDLRTVVIATSVLRPISYNHPELADEIPSTPEILQLARSLGMVVFEAGTLPFLASESAMRGDIPSAAARCLEGLRMVRGTSMNGLQSICLIATSHVAKARCDDELAAYFDATTRSADELVAAMAPHEWRTRHDEQMQLVREALGTTTFDAAQRRAASTPTRVAVEEAIAYLTPLVETPPATESECAADSPLTARQTEVLQLIARGLRNQEIANALHVAPKTVMHHSSAIYQALGVRGRSEATAWAVRNGLVD